MTYGPSTPNDEVICRDGLVATTRTAGNAMDVLRAEDLPARYDAVSITKSYRET